MDFGHVFDDRPKSTAPWMILNPVISGCSRLTALVPRDQAILSEENPLEVHTVGVHLNWIWVVGGTFWGFLPPQWPCLCRALESRWRPPGPQCHWQQLLWFLSPWTHCCSTQGSLENVSITISPKALTIDVGEEHLAPCWTVAFNVADWFGQLLPPVMVRF